MAIIDYRLIFIYIQMKIFSIVELLNSNKNRFKEYFGLFNNF